MGSSGYSNSLEVKVGMSEVWRFPGIGFSSCAAPTFSCVQGISNGGYESSFQNVPEQRMCTGTIPSMSTKTREAEVLSSYSLEVRGMCETELAYQKSRVEQDEMQVEFKFDIQNAVTYMTWGT